MSNDLDARVFLLLMAARKAGNYLVLIAAG
jgi:hypothetical protein